MFMSGSFVVGVVISGRLRALAVIDQLGTFLPALLVQYGLKRAAAGRDWVQYVNTFGAAPISPLACFLLAKVN
jgi:hypothetical protein